MTGIILVLSVALAAQTEQPKAAGRSQLITDFTCAQPRSGWTDADSTVLKPISKPPAGFWRIVDYKTVLYEGRALMTTHPESCALTIPLHRRGWYAISLGMSERQYAQAAIEVRLSGDEHWQIFRTSPQDGGGPLHEEPWCFADLSGRDLEVRYPRDVPAATGSQGTPLIDQFTVASLYSIRLTPVKLEHAALLEKHRHRPLVYFNDGTGIFYIAEKAGRHIVDTALGRFAGGDFDTCAFGNAGVDLMNFPSPAGRLAGTDGWDFVRPGDRRFRDHLVAMAAEGIDPMKQAIDKAHVQQQKLWMYLRPQAYTAEPPYDHILHSWFFHEHPELRCVEANGKPISKMSVAYPQVRDKLNEVVREGLKRGADGLCIAFNRGYPCARYEEPILRQFRDRYGIDTRTLPDSDPRLRRLWAESVTTWIRDVRRLLDEAGPSAGAQRRELAVMVGPDFEWNLRFGFDVESWAHQSLIDVVLPYPYVKDGEIDVAAFVRALQGTAIPLLPSLGTYKQEIRVAEIRQRAHRYYKAGADGLSRWDCPGQLARLRLDDPVQQALWCEHYFPPQQIEMTEYAGQNLAAFGPMLGF